MNINKYIISIAAFLIALTMSSCENKKEADNKKTVLRVKTEHAFSYNGLLTTTYTGVVEEKINTRLSFFSTGTVTDIYVTEGQQVKKGDLLARIDAASARNYYEIALAQEQKAQDAHDRLKPMHDNGTLPPIKMVESETALNQAKANTEIARKNLNDNNLYAPSSGTIGKIHFTSGMNTGPGTPVLDLLNINSVYIKIPVPEEEITRLKIGNKACALIPAVSKTVNGEVKEIGVVADLLTHSYPVKIEVSNPELLIKPGMVCTVTIASQSNTKGFLISSKSLQRDTQGRQFVYGIDDKNNVIKIEVQTISLINEKVLVEGDITEETQIIVSGQEKLSSQMRVETIH